MSWGRKEKYKTFSIPIKKKIKKINKDGNESVATISYKINFIDSARFMTLHHQILLIISQKEFIKLIVKKIS